jgi:hypothetical protein
MRLLSSLMNIIKNIILGIHEEKSYYLLIITEVKTADIHIAAPMEAKITGVRGAFSRAAIQQAILL